MWFRRNLGVFILGAVGLFFVASVLFPIFGRPRDDGHGRSNCTSNLKQIGLGLIQYIQDYDEKYPPAATSAESYGWANAIQPYLKSVQIYQCPKETSKVIGDFKHTGYTDYFYNAQMQKRGAGTVGEVTHLVVLTDGNDGQENTDARYAKTAIPAAWRIDDNSPSFRHSGMANYAFADGHVKALKVEQISTNWSATKFYFEPKKVTYAR